AMKVQVQLVPLQQLVVAEGSAEPFASPTRSSLAVVGRFGSQSRNGRAKPSAGQTGAAGRETSSCPAALPRSSAAVAGAGAGLLAVDQHARLHRYACPNPAQPVHRQRRAVHLVLMFIKSKQLHFIEEVLAPRSPK